MDPDVPNHFIIIMFKSDVYFLFRPNWSNKYWLVCFSLFIMYVICNLFAPNLFAPPLDLADGLYSVLLHFLKYLLVFYCICWHWLFIGFTAIWYSKLIIGRLSARPVLQIEHRNLVLKMIKNFKISKPFTSFKAQLFNSYFIYFLV